jgi:hypothetical protein
MPEVVPSAEQRKLVGPLPEVQRQYGRVAIVSEHADARSRHGGTIAVGAMKDGCAVQFVDALDIGHIVAKAIGQDEAPAAQHVAILQYHFEILLVS